MKKKTFTCLTLLISILLGIASFVLFNRTQFVTSPLANPSIIINQLPDTSFHLQMIYGSTDLQNIQIYDVTPEQFKIHETPYTSFTEGFMPRALNETLLAYVNQFRNLQKLAPISYYYHYKETDHYYFLSLSDGLDTLYIIDKHTLKVYTPSLSNSYKNTSDEILVHMTEKQYVYDVKESLDALYVLTAKANSYAAYLYRFDKQTFTLTDFKKISPSCLAVSPHHYALSSNGTAFFIAEDSIQVESLTTSYKIPLSYTPTHLYYGEEQLYALGLSNQSLDYTLFDNLLNPLQTGSLSLPNSRVSLISTFLNDALLYTVTYDATHPVYSNYLTLYDLSTGKIVYCMGLKRYSDLALLDVHFINTNAFY